MTIMRLCNVRLVIFSCISLLFSQCNINLSTDRLEYFKKGELSKELAADSAAARFYSELLNGMDEKPLRYYSDSVDAIRLIVRHPIYNPFIIHLVHHDSLTSVTFKVAGDLPGRERSGVSKLALNYESASERMDSLYQVLSTKLDRYDFYNAFDDPRDYDIADGTPYLLEGFYHGKYHLVRVIEVGKGSPFRGSADFFAIANSLYTFIPGDILPDLGKARTIDDIIFPVLSRDTLTAR